MKTLLKNYKHAREQGANAIENIKEATTKGQAYEGQHFELIALVQEQVFRASCTHGICSCSTFCCYSVI